MANYLDPYEVFRSTLAVGTAAMPTHGGGLYGGYERFLGVGPVFTGLDVRCFVLPTYYQHSEVFATTPLQEFVRNNWRGLSKTFDLTGRTTYHGMQASLSNSDKMALIENGTLGNMLGVSLSTHRDFFAVRTLGRINPKDFVGTTRTTAGTIIMELGDASPISNLLSPKYKSKLLHADELPPFNLYMTFMNDQGAWASCVIQGMRILDEGLVLEQSNSEAAAVSYAYLAMSSTPIAPGYFSLVPNAMDLFQGAIPEVVEFSGSYDDLRNSYRQQEGYIGAPGLQSGYMRRIMSTDLVEE